MLGFAQVPGLFRAPASGGALLVHTRFGIHLETLKPVVWMGRSRADMQAPPADTQQELGHRFSRCNAGTRLGTGIR